MKTKVKLTLFLGGFIVVYGLPSLYSQENASKFDASVFFENPFLEENAVQPVIFAKSFEEIEGSVGEINKLEIKEVHNRHDRSIIDKQYFITTDAFFIYYYYASAKKVFYRYLFQIHDTGEELKYGIRLGITISRLLELASEPYDIADHGTNIEYRYISFPFGELQINFSFEEGILTAINIWIGT